MLDATKAADVVLAVVCAAGGDDGGVDMDAMGDHLVALLKAQGLPTVIGIVWRPGVVQMMVFIQMVVVQMYPLRSLLLLRHPRREPASAGFSPRLSLRNVLL